MVEIGTGDPKMAEQTTTPPRRARYLNPKAWTFRIGAAMAAVGGLDIAGLTEADAQAVLAYLEANTDLNGLWLILGGAILIVIRAAAEKIIVRVENLIDEIRSLRDKIEK